jgi:hypothetical protein
MTIHEAAVPPVERRRVSVRGGFTVDAESTSV